MKRLLLILPLLSLWWLAGVAVQACAPIAPTLPPTPSLPPVTANLALPTALPSHTQTAFALPDALWLWAAGTPRAVDVKSGETLADFSQTLGEFTTARDKKWHFASTFERVGDNWNLYLSALDMTHGVGSYRILLFSTPYLGKELYEEALTTTELSEDESTAFVALTRSENRDWVTDIIRVHLDTRLADPPKTVMRAPAAWGPNPTISLTPDEQHIFVARANSRYENTKRFYSTRIVQVNATTLEVVNKFIVPEDIQTDANWVQVIASPSGDSFHVFENIWRDNGVFELRYSRFEETSDRPIITKIHQRSAFDTGCDSRFYLQPGDPRYAWQWCVTYVQFLDLQTGELAVQVQLPQGLAGGSFAEYAVTQDGKTLYTAYPLERQVVGLDLTTRTVTNRVMLPDTTALPDFRRALLDLLVSTASAKGLARPALALSPDEKWLAFVALRDFETVDGVWVIDLDTFEPLGHWLGGQEIIGVRASHDGTRLYALDRAASRVQIIAPTSGQTLGTLKLGSDEYYGFLSDVRP